MDAVKKELLMDAFADDYMTPEAIELVARARALAPKLAERAREAERQGMVPVETVKEMQEAGLFRVLQPKRWGGYELTRGSSTGCRWRWPRAACPPPGSTA